jgi:ectoine hydroxylase-related dioxygenase (phytanoyl-CoA dioxygenase family)
LIVIHLGQDAALSRANGSIKLPGTDAGGLHTDGSSIGHYCAIAEAEDGRRITSHVLGLNVIFCISDFTRNNGATHLVPDSFQIDSFRRPLPPVPGQIIVEVKWGSTLVFNYNTWHGASENRSQENRYAILSPWRRQ